MEVINALRVKFKKRICKSKKSAFYTVSVELSISLGGWLRSNEISCRFIRLVEAGQCS